MSVVEVVGLRKAFGGTIALDDVTVTAAEGELLLGPKGCGKTRLLRCVAGLTAVDAGTIAFNGQDVTATPARARNVGVVFQNYALFPNLKMRTVVTSESTSRRRLNLAQRFFEDGEGVGQLAAGDAQWRAEREDVAVADGEA